MKICACIAEYNPFHLGHLKHIDYMKNDLGADKIIVLMSGNFTQRGEPAILNKFTRAREAVIAGADMVIELPTVFATSNAEIFAKGAIKILDSLGVVDGICFGVESAEKDQLISIGAAMNNESKEFKKALKENLDKGLSFAKARFNAVCSVNNFDESILSKPNNILGIEYTRAILNLNSKMQIFPMKRDENHNDNTLKKGITSATSIRLALKEGKKKKIKKSLPPHVYKDINGYPFAFEKIILSKLATTSEKDLKEILDCTEGLENRIKALLKDNKSLDLLVEKISTKRYTQARIRRILISNLLGIDKNLVEDSLNSPLYAKILAVSKDSKDLISLISQNSVIPLLTRKSDESSLKKTALLTFEKDVLANDVYNIATDINTNEHNMVIV